MKSFLGGILGGFVIIAFLIIALFAGNPYNYQIHIINPNTPDSINANLSKLNIINEMEASGVLLTPQEYTNNVINYYNVALAIMAALLVIFSLISYFHLKFISEEQMQKYMKSDEFMASVKTAIFGKAEETFATNEKVESLQNLVSSIDLERIMEIDSIVEELKQEVGKLIESNQTKK
jgi:hypothetical protein